jgi:hypothetical protein
MAIPERAEEGAEGLVAVTIKVSSVADNARLWHPWLRIQCLIRVILETRWVPRHAAEPAPCHGAWNRRVPEGPAVRGAIRV